MTSANVVADGLGQKNTIRRPEMARPRFMANTGEQNVGNMERMIGGLLGVGLVYFGLKRKSLKGLALAAAGTGLVYRSTTGHCSGYSALGIDTAGKTVAKPEDYFARGVHVDQSFLILKPVEEVYAFWRNFENLPTFMTHLERVEKLTDTRSRWTAKAPLGMHVSWEAEIIHDQPNERIAWKSVENTTVANAGSVTFNKHGDATEVRVVLDYIPPAGAVGKVIAQLFGEEPSQTVREDLRRFKMKMETGEIATVNGQSQGQCNK